MKFQSKLFVLLMVILLALSIVAPVAAEGDKNCYNNQWEYKYQYQYLYEGTNSSSYSGELYFVLPTGPMANPYFNYYY